MIWLPPQCDDKQFGAVRECHAVPKVLVLLSDSNVPQGSKHSTGGVALRYDCGLFIAHACAGRGWRWRGWGSRPDARHDVFRQRALRGEQVQEEALNGT